MKDKDTKKIRQEDSLKLENEKVYFTIWDLPNRISKKQVTEIIKKFGQPREIHILHSINKKTRAEVEWSSIRKDIKRKLEAPNKRLNNKEKIDQERHRLEELAQRLLGATVVTKNIAIESRFSSTAKKDKEKEPRVLK
ncbi:31652_t:CDS:2, partial [Gigaspora margarita]